MANVLDRVREGISLFNRAEEIFKGVTGTLADGREAVRAERLDQLQAMLEQEKLETQAAANGLREAIAGYRKERGL